MPPGVRVSGLESDGGDRFFCGGGNSGKVRAVRRPKRGSAAYLFNYPPACPKSPESRRGYSGWNANLSSPLPRSKRSTTS